MLIKHVIEADDNQSIPQEIYEQFPINDIARAIVMRTRRQEIDYKSRFETDPILDLNRDSDLIIFFPPKALMPISRDGFKSQHETQTSKGTFDPELRSQVEDNFTGIQMGQEIKARKLRPKSAFLNIRTSQELAQKSAPEISYFQYGRIGAVLKDSVKQRALWTFDDSGTFGLNTQKSTGQYLAKYRGTFQRGSISIATDLENRTEPGEKNLNYHRYYEGLIYGELDFNDVDHFLVSRSADANFLRHLGKPIFKIKKVQRHRRTIFEKGELIYAPGAVMQPETYSDHPMQKLLRAAGIDEKLVAIESWKIEDTRVAISELTTESTDYFVFSRGDSAEWYPDFISAYLEYSVKLEKLGIKTKPLIKRSLNYAIFHGLRDGLFLSEIPSEKRSVALDELKKLIYQLVNNEMFLIVDPSLLIVERDNQLTVLGYDQLSRSPHSRKQIIDAYQYRVNNFWRKYFEKSEIDQLNDWLEKLERSFRPK